MLKLNAREKNILNNKKIKGFTLIELVIVIVIVVVLSVVAVPIYRGYTRKSMATEGKALLKMIQSSQKVYFSEFYSYKKIINTNFDEQLDIDARANKYFTGFKVDIGGDKFTATTSGSGGATGISLTLIDERKANAVWIDNGLND